MLNRIRLDGIKKKSGDALLWIWPQHHHALPEATAEIIGNHAHFAHRRFTSENQVARFQFRPSASLLEVSFIGVARRAQVESATSDVLIPKHNHAAISPGGSGVWAVGNLFAEFR
jgi:hypothetical protein